MSYFMDQKKKYIPRPSMHIPRPFKPGDNQEEYAAVQKNIQEHGENREPEVDERMNRFE